MIYRFDPFSLDTESFELRRDGDVVAVEPQVFNVLAFLIKNRDRIVTKDEMIEAVWDGRAISDGALNSRINSARRAVGDDGDTQSIIKTIPRRGFRFVAAIGENAETAARTNLRASSADKPSIAVMPFANLSNDPEQEHFSDGIVEDLIAALSRIRRFRVAGRSSTFSYKARLPDSRQIAHELGVRYVIEGSVRKSGNKIRLNVELIDGESGDAIWVERYDRELEDIFTLQDELTLAIVGALEPALSRSERSRARRKSPESLDAWEAYQHGMSYFYKRTADDMTTARRLFQQAISIDPQFALAHAAYARTYFWNLLLETEQMDREEAESAALRAVRLDPEEAEAYLALGYARWVNRDFERAISEFETAISLNPSYAQAYHGLATTLIHTGRPEEAIPHLLTAISLSPKDAEIAPFHARLAAAYLFLGRYQEAVEWGRKAVRLPELQWPGHCFLVASLAHLNKTEEARAALADLMALRPGITLRFVDDRYPSAIQSQHAHLLDGLRKAGLPEN